MALVARSNIYTTGADTPVFLLSALFYVHHGIYARVRVISKCVAATVAGALTLLSFVVDDTRHVREFVRLGRSGSFLTW